MWFECFVYDMETPRISIQQQGQDLLNIAAWKDNEMLYSESLSKDSNDFICEDGWLKIKTSTLGGGSGIPLESSSTSRNFANSDGYLLEKQEQESFVVIFIIPTAGSTVKWYRFARKAGE